MCLGAPLDCFRAPKAYRATYSLPEGGTSASYRPGLQKKRYIAPIVPWSVTAVVVATRLPPCCRLANSPFPSSPRPAKIPLPLFYAAMLHIVSVLLLRCLDCCCYCCYGCRLVLMSCSACTPSLQCMYCSQKCLYVARSCCYEVLPSAATTDLLRSLRCSGPPALRWPRICHNRQVLFLSFSRLSVPVALAPALVPGPIWGANNTAPNSLAASHTRAPRPSRAGRYLPYLLPRPSLPYL